MNEVAERVDGEITNLSLHLLRDLWVLLKNYFKHS